MEVPVVTANIYMPTGANVGRSYSTLNEKDESVSVMRLSAFSAGHRRNRLHWTWATRRRAVSDRSLYSVMYHEQRVFDNAVADPPSKAQVPWYVWQTDRQVAECYGGTPQFSRRTILRALNRLYEAGLIAICTFGPNGRYLYRAVMPQNDPHWRDHPILVNQP